MVVPFEKSSKRRCSVVVVSVVVVAMGIAMVVAILVMVVIVVMTVCRAIKLAVECKGLVGCLRLCLASGDSAQAFLMGLLLSRKLN